MARIISRHRLFINGVYYPRRVFKKFLKHGVDFREISREVSTKTNKPEYFIKGM